MTNSMRAEADASRDAKMQRMGLKVTTADMGDAVGEGHSGPAKDGTQGKASGGYADQYQDGAPDKVKAFMYPTTPPSNGDAKSRPRLDRPKFARGGHVGKKGTTVNVIVAPGGAAPAGGPPPLPIAPPAGGPMPALPISGPAGAGPVVPPMMGRKRGGRVAYTAGAGSGPGREQKIKAYGSKAGPVK